MTPSDASRQPGAAAGRFADRVAAHPAIALLLLTLLLRGPTLGLAEINWDESAFALVAREILHGYWPFTTAFDNKPIGLYLHLAAAMAVIGDDPLALRLLGVGAVAGSAIIVHAIAARRFGLPPRAALLVAACFPLASMGFGGMAVYSEHLANLHLLAAMLFLLGSRSTRTLAAAGALAGVAVQTNYLATPIVAALGVALVIGNRGRLSARLRDAAAFGFGAMAAFAFLLLPVLLTDASEYFGPQVRFIADYRLKAPSLAGQLFLHARFLASLVPLFALAAALAWIGGRRSAQGRTSLIPIVAMLAGALVAVLLTGHVYPHYFLLMLPPLFLLVAALLAATPSGDARRIGGIMLGAISLSIGLGGLETAAFGVRDLWFKTAHRSLTADPPRALAQRIRSRLGPGETIYVVCAPPVLYQLAGVRPPTRLPFYLHHLDPVYARTLGTTPRAEVARIVASRPALIILGDVDQCGGIGSAAWQMVAQAAYAAGYRKTERHGATTLLSASAE